MKRFALCLASALCLVASSSACLRVIHDTVYVVPDLAEPERPPDLAQPLHVQALYVVNLARSSANLGPAYSAVIRGIAAGLATRLIFVDESAVLPINGPIGGAPAFVYGTSGSLLSPTTGDLDAALASAAASGVYDGLASGGGAEQFNLADIGRRLDTATLPPSQNGGQSRPAFSSPMDLLLVITIQPVRRSCALTDAACRVRQSAPLDYFSSARSDGTLDWLHMSGGQMNKAQVRYLFITTSEGESASDFAARCAAVPGFPKTLLDVIEPSPAGYYQGLSDGLSGRGILATRIDLCDLLGASGASTLEQAARRLLP